MTIIERIIFVFFEANRYKLVLKGLRMTISISLVAVIFGVILGLIIAIMKLTEERKGRKTILSRFANGYIDVIRGTPLVIQLMLIFHVVFSSRSSLGFYAAVLAFGINSGAYVSEIIRAGILAVDRGQTEAGRSLGFSYGETMRYIILPQAIKNILPALGNEFIVLIKETAIVGYIAVLDLTKASDFIISRTYTSFIPLIGIAIIYFIIIKILTKALQAFERRLRQSDIR